MLFLRPAWFGRIRPNSTDRTPAPPKLSDEIAPTWGLAAAASWAMVVFTALVTAYYFRLMYTRMFANEA